MTENKQWTVVERATRKVAALAVLCAFVWPSFGRAAVPAPMLEIQPAELAALLSRKGAPPLIFHVGFHVLYVQAHIPGARYAGPASDARAIEQLRRELSTVPKDVLIILYCGCCPWDKCPNVTPAYKALRELSLTNVKVLHLDHNFGIDWVDKGYPVERAGG